MTFQPNAQVVGTIAGKGIYLAISVDASGNFTLTNSTTPLDGSAVPIVCEIDGVGTGLIFSEAADGSHSYTVGAVPAIGTPILGFAAGPISSIQINASSAIVTAGAFSTTLTALVSGSGGVVDPVPAGSLFIVLGNSIDEYNFTAGSNLTQKQTGLIMINACGGEAYQALNTDPRVALIAYNDLARTQHTTGNAAPYYTGSDWGYAGASLADILAMEITQAAAWLGGRTALGKIGGGTNSMQLDDATFQAAHAANLDAAHAAMPNVLWGVETVRTVNVSISGASGRNAANIAAKNALIAANVAARSSFCRLIDYSAYANDGGNPGYGLAINYATSPYQPSPGGDGLHPNQVGPTVYGSPADLAFIQAHASAGNAIRLAKVSSAMPVGLQTWQGSAVINKTASVGGGTITGNIPANTDVSWSNNNISSCVCSLIDNSANLGPGAQIWRFTITPSGANTSESFSALPQFIAISTTALRNQFARLWMDAQVDQGAGWLRCTMQAAERSNTVNNFTQVQVGLYPQGAGNRRMKGWVTPHLQFPPGSTGFNPSAGVFWNPSAGGGPYVLDLYQWDMQIENPPVPV